MQPIFHVVNERVSSAYFERFVPNPLDVRFLATLPLVGHIWRPLFRLFTRNILFDVLVCDLSDWQPRTLCGAHERDMKPFSYYSHQFEDVDDSI